MVMYWTKAAARKASPSQPRMMVEIVMTRRSNPAIGWVSPYPTVQTVMTTK
jgi:hypothetical protein